MIPGVTWGLEEFERPKLSEMSLQSSKRELSEHRLSTWHKLETWKRLPRGGELQLRICLHWTGLWAWLWAIFFTVGSTTLGQVAALTSLKGRLWSIRVCKPNKPFPFWVASGSCFILTTKNQTRPSSPRERVCLCLVELVKHQILNSEKVL